MPIRSGLSGRRRRSVERVTLIGSVVQFLYLPLSVEQFQTLSDEGLYPLAAADWHPTTPAEASINAVRSMRSHTSPVPLMGPMRANS